MSGLLILVLVYAVFFGWACGYLADRKGFENVTTWQVLGFFFGVFALIVVGFAPARRGASEEYAVCETCGVHLPATFMADHEAAHR